MTRPSDKIRDHITYDPATGIFRWISKRANGRGQPGDRADHPAKGGYRRVPFERKYYAAHRLAWWMVTNDWPALTVDHKNCVRDDNRIDNLRPATPRENSINSRRPVNNTSGFKGVSWSEQTQKWRAYIKIEGRWTHIGLFDTPESAHAAYVSVSRKHYGEFTRPS